MSQTIFPDGLIFKTKREKAPDFVKGHLSVKVDDFVPFLKKHENKGWVNIDILKSKEGRLYLKLDNWKKEEAKEEVKEEFPVIQAEPENVVNVDDVPF